jgi:arginase
MQRIELIMAPTNLGLRPLRPGHEPGTWRAPAALAAAGLIDRLEPESTMEVARPPYSFVMDPDTRLLNADALRAHALVVADAVERALRASRFALVVGGDCSLVLGCLEGARRGGRCGLVYVDGHSDFMHPGNHDVRTRPGAVAGMDLALATGRGEAVLSRWPSAAARLVEDDDVVQIGDRESADSPETIPPVLQFTADQVVALGHRAVCAAALDHLSGRGMTRAWLHVDLDVLDQAVMPAVDSPGSPGLDFQQLGETMATLIGSGRFIGMDVTIYDPELDPAGEYVVPIVDAIATGLGRGQRQESTGDGGR